MVFKGLDEAVKDYNWAEHAAVMIDIETNEVWTDIFCGCGEYKVYHSDDVKHVLTKHAIYPKQYQTDKVTLKELCLEVLMNVSNN
ncbi:hypothetical protein [Lysinibacillus sp. LZ02]|uniref:hypothetical protein n=1 Tax=Lysinibacillus sp. LZ02 TaxID=3420668 RepID=UPI003D35EAAE